MIEKIIVNGEALVNVPADMAGLVELGLTPAQAVATLNEYEAKRGFYALRTARLPLLLEADYLVNIALDNNQDATPFRVYRQALRDITGHYQTMDNIVWPQKPSLPQASA